MHRLHLSECLRSKHLGTTIQGSPKWSLRRTQKKVSSMRGTMSHRMNDAPLFLVIGKNLVTSPLDFKNQSLHQTKLD